MTEIRSICAGEAEGFLGLLCDVFDLDYARAHSIFFSEPFFNLERKWALFGDGQMLSILTTVPLVFGWGRAIGIAGVATARGREREGLAGQLILRVLRDSFDRGEGAVLLFAKDTRLYQRLGFEVLDEVVQGPIDSTPETEVPLSMDFDQVRSNYDLWAAADANRLRRDETRWNYWRWNLRICTPFHGGYLCYEGGIVREVITPERAPSWDLPADTEWLGLASMATRLGVPLRASETTLYLMGFRVPGTPQLFMTDQF